MYTVFKILTDDSKSTQNTGCHDSKFNYQEDYFQKGIQVLNDQTSTQ